MPITTDNHPHVAVLAFPFGSHAASLLSIAHRLATLSPTTYFSFFSTPSSNSSILSAYTKNDTPFPPNLKAYDVWDGVPNGYVFVGKHAEDIELFINAAQESFKKGMQRAVEESGRRVTCLVTDAFFWFGRQMAEEIGGDVGWVAFCAACPYSLSAHVYTDFIRETIGVGDIAGREDELLKSIPGMSKIRIRDLPEGVVFGGLDSLFSQMLHKMGQMLPQADAVFTNSFEELDPTVTNDLKSKFRSYLNIGPFNLLSPPPKLPNPHNCITWLNRQGLASVAYVSFGSAATPPPHELVALAEALEAGKVPFIWSLKDSAKVHLPNGFLERTKFQGIVVPWAPQLEVLAHEAVGVFITHCGWNSLLESVAGGVPMICRPFYGDQRLNARMIEDVWEIGLKVEGGIFTKDGVMDCFDKILFQEEEGKKMRDKIRTLKDVAVTAIRQGGRSSNNFRALLGLVSTRKW